MTQDWTGIILAGGAGTRLHPITKGVTKQLLPVYDKPMIYYPLATLIQCGIKDIIIITSPEERNKEGFRDLLGHGEAFGVEIKYLQQARPEGIAQALRIVDDEIGTSNVALILGDNIFHSEHFSIIAQETMSEVSSGKSDGAIFGIEVGDYSRYGVVGLDADGFPERIIEKPSDEDMKVFSGKPFAVPGLYFYDVDTAITIACGLKPSARGEYEITDLHRDMIAMNSLYVEPLPRGVAWFDAGTFDSLMSAAEYVRTVQKDTGVMVGSPEDAAIQQRFITKAEACYD